LGIRKGREISSSLRRRSDPAGKYRFLKGGLDDLDRLPVMRNVPLKALITSPRIDLPPAEVITSESAEIVPEGVRNDTLWRACMRALGEGRITTRHELLAFANAFNQTKCLPPQPEEDVMCATESAWRYQQEGRNWFGKPGIYFPAYEADRMIRTGADAFTLLAFARANNGPDRTFMLANGLAEVFGWSRKRLASARKRLLGRTLN
jgi:hypothetical protein